MRQIINGKLYSTDSAVLKAYWDTEGYAAHEIADADFHESLVKDDFVAQSLYRTKDGEYFLWITEMATNSSSVELEEEFWKEWMQHKDGCIVIAHCGSPVESGLLRRCVERDLENRQWSAPFTLHDVATLLLMKGEDPLSVDKFMKKYGIKPQFKGTAHHPMYDAVCSAQVWEELYNG